jgi:hypothetical protein
MLLVERHYLRKWGGNFTENFYGMKRERVIAQDLPRAAKVVPDILSESTKLRGPDVWKSLFIIVGDTTVFRCFSKRGDVPEAGQNRIR